MTVGGTIDRRSLPVEIGGFEPLLLEFRARLDAELYAFLERKREAAEERGGAPLADSIERLLRGGGKRLRPALVYHAYRACGGAAVDVVMPLAMSLELLHAYLLIHDDIMDHAEMRRGLPAAHAQFREQHRELGWSGDPGDFGRSMAILLGDLAHAWAVELYTEAVRREERASSRADRDALDRAFSEMSEEVVLGQYLEMMAPHGRDPSEEELLRILRLKSGRYSVERPIQLGALLADAAEPTLRAFARYGVAIGDAFQLQDDVLGVFGEAASVGKPVGSDLKEGKHTFLIHHTLRNAAPKEARRLRELLGRADLSGEEIGSAQAIIRATGGLAAVEEMIDACLGDALAALDELSLESESRVFFVGLLRYLKGRER
ncbi:MAG: polyprenyl synthetase family protein [Gemmatimonadota bacterium]